MKWGVIVYSPQVRKEVILEDLDRAKALVIAAREKYRDRPEVQAELISRTKAFPPPKDFEINRKRWWCPYCRKVRIFQQDPKIDKLRCPICGISESDFYVRKYNHLWNFEQVKKVVKKKK